MMLATGINLAATEASKNPSCRIIRYLEVLSSIATLGRALDISKSLKGSEGNGQFSWWVGSNT